jgi:hypothetical protein
MNEATINTPMDLSATEQTGTDNPAVARCCAAMLGACRKERATGATGFMSEKAGEKAYRYAMPPLAGQDNIRDFVACAAHGVLIGAIDTRKGNQLLYAAQVALTIDRHNTREPRQRAA